MDSDYESVLLVKKEVFLYNLPPRQSNRGYRASEWNLETPSWTGRMRIVTRGSSGQTIYIRLEDHITGKLYAQAPVEEFPGIAVEQVLDSSRYFAIRLVSDDARTIYVGIGFSERSDSFDFNVAIQDHFKQCKQEEEVKNAPLDQPALDLGLKEGQRFRLNFNTKRTGEKDSTTPTRSARPMPSLKLGGGAIHGLLPPPTSASRNRSVPTADNPASSQINQPTSNSDLLIDIFQSPAPPVNAPPKPSEVFADWSLL